MGHLTNAPVPSNVIQPQYMTDRLSVDCNWKQSGRCSSLECALTNVFQSDEKPNLHSSEKITPFQSFKDQDLYCLHQSLRILLWRLVKRNFFCATYDLIFRLFRIRRIVLSDIFDGYVSLNFVVNCRKDNFLFFLINLTKFRSSRSVNFLGRPVHDLLSVVLVSVYFFQIDRIVLRGIFNWEDILFQDYLASFKAIIFAFCSCDKRDIKMAARKNDNKIVNHFLLFYKMSFINVCVCSFLKK